MHTIFRLVCVMYALLCIVSFHIKSNLYDWNYNKIEQHSGKQLQMNSLPDVLPITIFLSCHPKQPLNFNVIVTLEMGRYRYIMHQIHILDTSKISSVLFYKIWASYSNAYYVCLFVCLLKTGFLWVTLAIQELTVDQVALHIILISSVFKSVTLVIISLYCMWIEMYISKFL